MSRTWTFTYKQITDATEGHLRSCVETRDLVLSKISDPTSRMATHLQAINSAEGALAVWRAVTRGLSTVTSEWSTDEKRFRAAITGLHDDCQAEENA